MPGNARAGGILVHKEMTISHRDFLRILPGALEDGDFRIDGHRITAGEGARRLEIELVAGNAEEDRPAHASGDARIPGIRRL